MDRREYSIMIPVKSGVYESSDDQQDIYNHAVHWLKNCIENDTPVDFGIIPSEEVKDSTYTKPLLSGYSFQLKMLLSPSNSAGNETQILLNYLDKIRKKYPPGTKGSLVVSMAKEFADELDYDKLYESCEDEGLSFETLFIMGIGPVNDGDVSIVEVYPGRIKFEKNIVELLSFDMTKELSEDDLKCIQKI